MRPEFYLRLRDVVGSDKGVGGGIDTGKDTIGDFGVESLALDEHGRFASAELFGFHEVRFEIVADVFAYPDLVLVLDADLAVGGGVGRLEIGGHSLGGQNSAAGRYDHTVAPRDGFEIRLNVACIRE